MKGLKGSNPDGFKIKERSKIMKGFLITIIIAMMSFSGLTGCSKEFWGGTATGAVGAGAAYELQNKRQMDRLE
jgi:hypothetical protein